MTTTQSVFEKRLARFRDLLVKHQIDAAFLPISGDLQYLTGVLRPAHKPTNDNKHGDEIYGAFITADRGPLFVAPLMGASDHIQSESRGKPWIEGMLVLKDGDNILPFTRDVLRQLGSPGRIGLHTRQWARTMILLQAADPQVEFVDLSPLLAPMKAVKDQAETALMQEAGAITDQIFAQVLKSVRPGVTDYELTRDIEYQAVRLGASGMSFHTKVLVGGATVRRDFHADGKTSNTQVVPGSTIAFDFGVIYKGYVSDFGRTVFCDTPPAQLADKYKLVIESQSTGISLMKGGSITAAGLNSAMRDVFLKHGLKDYMGMRFGHGIGIDVHEPPFLFERDETILRDGMCFTVEPSLRLPHSMWIRVEDVVQVTSGGGMPFSSFSRELMIV